MDTQRRYTGGGPILPDLPRS